MKYLLITLMAFLVSAETIANEVDPLDTCEVSAVRSAAQWAIRNEIKDSKKQSLYKLAGERELNSPGKKRLSVEFHPTQAGTCWRTVEVEVQMSSEQSCAVLSVRESINLHTCRDVWTRVTKGNYSSSDL